MNSASSPGYIPVRNGQENLPARHGHGSRIRSRPPTPCCLAIFAKRCLRAENRALTIFLGICVVGGAIFGGLPLVLSAVVFLGGFALIVEGCAALFRSDMRAQPVPPDRADEQSRHSRARVEKHNLFEAGTILDRDSDDCTWDAEDVATYGDNAREEYECRNRKLPYVDFIEAPQNLGRVGGTRTHKIGS